MILGISPIFGNTHMNPFLVANLTFRVNAKLNIFGTCYCLIHWLGGSFWKGHHLSKTCWAFPCPMDHQQQQQQQMAPWCWKASFWHLWSSCWLQLWRFRPQVLPMWKKLDFFLCDKGFVVCFTFTCGQYHDLRVLFFGCFFLVIFTQMLFIKAHLDSSTCAPEKWQPTSNKANQPSTFFTVFAGRLTK